MRGGGRKINLSFIEKPQEIAKVNIMQDSNAFEKFKEEEFLREKEKQMNELVLKNIKFKYSPLKLIAELPIEEQSQQNMLIINDRDILADPNRYLLINPHDKESKSTRDFVMSTRKMLFTKISIQDKEEELFNIKESLVQDQEKLLEAQKSLREDTNKFKNYQDEVEKQLEISEQKMKDTLDEKKIYDEEIERYQDMIQDIDIQIRQTENEISPYKKQKRFIFSLAEDFLYKKE
ncbi:UNKNOWN [Stylonychia lemnae]|uniref:DUF4200 domain-containing protein n=1 Tax=Stylonychia lemnae TaxID=5949 RepID=A0A078AX91_STYLE|nr:UNKNOWN [Stylonychia lemnae]|eukprot:CDW87075.1 UNKNOWN [Stylonychia lemnae]